MDTQTRASTKTAEKPRTTSPAPVPARRRKNWLPYALMAPAMAYLLVVMIYPLLQGVMLSFTNTKLVNPFGGRNIGLENYQYLVESERFWGSVGTTLVYTAFSVVFAVGLGVLAALAINRAFKGRLIVRGLLTVPWAVPTVAAGLIFAWIFNREDGVLNEITGALGLGQHGWLTDPQFGLFAVVTATVWKMFPLVMLIVLAALQSIPAELYEAASLDGASDIKQTRHITLPSIAPTVRMITLLMTIWSIRRFEIIYLLTGGGPQESTQTMVVNIFITAFHDQNLGRAAAIGVFGLALSLMVTVVYFIAERRMEKKEA